MLIDGSSNPRNREIQKEETEDRHGFLRTLAFVILVFAIAAGAWYAYPAARRYQAQFAQYVTAQKHAQEVIDSMNGDVKQTGAKVEAWANDQQALRDQIARLRATTRVQLGAAVKQAEETSSQFYNRIQAQIDERFEGVRTRLARVEASTATDQARINELRGEVDQARRDLAKQAADLAAVRQDVERNGALQGRELADLQTTQDSARHDVDAIQQRLAVRRVDFEVPKSQSREVADGISVNVTGTDPARRTLNGSISLQPDRRIIWLRSQNLQQPVVFYGSQDGQKRELVITDVTRNSVVGYLLLPPDRSEPPPARVGE
jgi:hypothetical protein